MIFAVLAHLSEYIVIHLSSRQINHLSTEFQLIRMLMYVHLPSKAHWKQ